MVGTYWCPHSGSVWRILKKLKTNLPNHLAIALLSMCPKDSAFYPTVTCSFMFIVTLFTIA